MPNRDAESTQRFLDEDLEWPLRHSDADGVRELFARGANPNTRWLVASPLSWAMTCQSDEMALAVYLAGGRQRANEERDLPAVCQAARKGLPRLLEQLLADGAKLEISEASDDPLQTILFLHDEKWSPADVEAWIIALRAHSNPRHLASFPGRAWGERFSALLEAGAEPALAAWIDEALSRPAGNAGSAQTPAGFAHGLGRGLCCAASEASPEAIGLFLRAQRRAAEAAGSASLKIALQFVGESLNAALRAGRPLAAIAPLADEFAALAANPWAKPAAGSAAEEAWMGWAAAPSELQKEYLQALHARAVPLTPQTEAFGPRLGPWLPVGRELDSDDNSSWREQMREKAKFSASALIEAGAWPHPSVFSRWPELAVAAKTLLAEHQAQLPWTFAAGDAGAEQRRPPPGAAPPEGVRWLLATLEAAALRLMVDAQPGASRAAGAVPGAQPAPARRPLRV